MNNATFNLLGARDFFREYPVVYVGGASGVTWKPSAVTAVSAGAGDLQIVSSGTRISYCAFSQFTDPMNTGGVTTATNKEQTRIDVFAADPGGGIPLFYLPYALNHNRRMTLTDKQHIGGVSLFLTDLVDGCSLYVEGSPDKPSVYHINANREKPNGMADLSQTMSTRNRLKSWKHKWAHMDQRFHVEGADVSSIAGKIAKPTRPAAAPLPNLQPPSKVESRDYMLITKNQDEAFAGMLGQMQVTTRCPSVLNGQSVDSLEIAHSQGTVFGVATGGMWKFYVQKRVLALFFHHNLVPIANQSLSQRAKGIFGPQPYTKMILGSEWIIRTVDQFWPTVKTGRLVP